MAIANITGNILTDTGVAISSLVSGSGTTNYLPKFTGASTLGDSVIQEVSGNIGIGGAPSTKFQVTGTIGNFQIASSGAEIYLTRNENNDILATGGTSSGITIGAQSFLKFKVGTSYTERIIINSSGNIGINTSSVSEGTQASGSISIIPVSSVSSAPLIQFPGNGRIRPASTGDRLSIDGNALFLNSTFGGNIIMATGGGNVGIGTSSPTTTLHLSTTNGIRMQYVGNSGFSQIATDIANNTIFSGFSAEYMRITGGGAVLINTTTDPGANARLGVINGFGQEGLCIKMGSTGAYSPIAVRDTTGAEMFNIRENGAMDNPYAYNTTTGSAANVFVNTIGRFLRSSSSLKYKTDVRDYDKGLAKVLQMRPVYYKGKSEDDGDTQFAGLIAEEIHDLGLTEFVQYAEDGTPDALAYQNMVALLTKAIQELSAKVSALENKS